MKPNKFIANILYIAHNLLILTLFYFALFARPEETYMAIAIVSVIYLTWGLFGGECIITSLENEFQEETNKSGFVSKTLGSLFGERVKSDYIVDLVSNVTFIALVLISLYRLGKWANN